MNNVKYTKTYLKQKNTNNNIIIFKPFSMTFYVFIFNTAIIRYYLIYQFNGNELLTKKFNKP